MLEMKSKKVKLSDPIVMFPVILLCFFGMTWMMIAVIRFNNLFFRYERIMRIIPTILS